VNRDDRVVRLTSELIDKVQAELSAYDSTLSEQLSITREKTAECDHDLEAHLRDLQRVMAQVKVELMMDHAGVDPAAYQVDSSACRSCGLFAVIGRPGVLVLVVTEGVAWEMPATAGGWKQHKGYCGPREDLRALHAEEVKLPLADLGIPRGRLPWW
jgi:hypothetical protein